MTDGTFLLAWLPVPRALQPVVEDCCPLFTCVCVVYAPATYGAAGFVDSIKRKLTYQPPPYNTNSLTHTKSTSVTTN
jgi:hypothetical protein